MATYKFKGAVSIASNSFGSSTGYGVQGKYLAEKLLKHGVKVANLSNYGLEGRKETMRLKTGDVKHYPRGQVLYSEDVMQLWHKDFTSAFPELQSYLFTLYDVWVYNNLKFDGEIISWVPLDHITLPPQVAKFLLRPQVTPITMSPHGQRQLEEAGIDSTYIPHAVDTKVFKANRHLRGNANTSIPRSARGRVPSLDGAGQQSQWPNSPQSAGGAIPSLRNVPQRVPELVSLPAHGAKQSLRRFRHP